ncbi:tetratricopeptide repeat protein [Reichenbachiella ulvae]|uniref:Tetratricopeptide repeat protein n=1 Tax=Reichenbachiella ulvae TaxID=2980104 RepID=A0ABT3CUN9_9BACT|nr:tetratricopeptide repeat protein [Reichenbachiella ulvae]MCV9386953.1 tetratricopeptide repeat protein [Reichenbachiella ulvae]
MDLERALHKAEHYLNQERYDEAKKEVNSFLASDPENTSALQLLIRIHLAIKQYKKADELTDQLLKRNPSDPENLYLKAVIQAQLGKRKSALKFANSALTFDPSLSIIHGLKASIYYQQSEFEKALESANTGLSSDPHDETCLNFKSMALLEIGNEDEQLNADEQALKNNPMNPTTHATVGFNALHRNETEKAKSHFREALRIDPSNEFARSGMIQAIKSTNFVYNLFLKYVFWMSSLKPQVRWAVVIVGYLLIQFLNEYSGSMGSFKPIASAIIVLYMVFAISTWIIGPVSNIFLRFHSFGKYMLSQEEKKSATLSAILLGLSLLSAMGLHVFREDIQWYNLAFYLLCIGIALTVVVSSIENATLERSKKRLTKVGSIFAIACGIVLIMAVVTPGLAVKYFSWCLYGFIGYQFFANSQE